MGKCTRDSCLTEHLSFAKFCWEHLDDKKEYVTLILKKLASGDTHKELNLRKVCFTGHEFNKAYFRGANLSMSDFSNCILIDADFQGSDLMGANFNSADLTGANFVKADLTKACVAGARLWHAKFNGANLVEADFQNSDLWNASLCHTRMWRTNLKATLSLSKNSFGLQRNGRYISFAINEKGASSAEDAYRSIKQLFMNDGRYADASWASFKEKCMYNIRLYEEKNLQWIPTLIMGLLCGYGEKAARIIIASMCTILFYSLVYYFSKLVVFLPDIAYIPRYLDCLYYSIVTFTTVGYGDFIPKSVPAFRIVAASEAFMGVFLSGLFVFTLARKYSAR